MSETKERKNPDYTASAKDLSSPEPTIKAYENWWASKTALEKAELEIEAKIPSELITARDNAQTAVQEAFNILKELVTDLGGFQNLETGEYALQQRKISRSYAVEPFKIHCGEYTPQVLIEAIDGKALESLIKAGKLKEDALKERGIIIEKETFAYIIK